MLYVMRLLSVPCKTKPDIKVSFEALGLMPVSYTHLTLPTSSTV